MSKLTLLFIMLFLIVSLVSPSMAQEEHPLSYPGVLSIKIGKSTGSAGVSIQKDGKILVSAPSFVDNQDKEKLILIRRDADGRPDRTFGKVGMIITGFSVSSVHSEGLVLQEDGKAVLAGWAIPLDKKNKWTGASNDDVLVIRFNTDGQLDKGFDSSGWVKTDVDGEIDKAYGLAVQKDRKIVVIGNTSKVSGYHFVVLRYNEDGTLDRGFGKKGKVITRIGSVSEDSARAIAIQSDGKILVAGTAHRQKASDIALVRYKADGRIDSHFGIKGKVMKHFGRDEERISSVANNIVIQPDGKIIISVNLYRWGSAYVEGILMRYHDDGRLDQSFGTGGSVTVKNHGYVLDAIGSLALQKDGKILFTGASYDTEKRRYAIVTGRYNVNGGPDTSFGNNGLTDIPMGKSRAAGRKLAIQSNGGVVVVGNAGKIDSNAISHWTSRYPPDLVLFRLKIDGRIDKHFSSSAKSY